MACGKTIGHGETCQVGNECEACCQKRHSPKMPTRDEIWAHLKSLPTPPIEVLLSGETMMYYVNACYDYMCQNFGQKDCPDCCGDGDFASDTIIGGRDKCKRCGGTGKSAHIG